MQFSKLRLTGFKSFVDATELAIEPGVTGIVGPNGCGKSNLVEALKWVMGETSAKQVRGGEMDDVIFSGTTDRPARNIGEVVLGIDNSDRTASAPFNDQVEIEVSRRIEREKGSTYRINAKEVRARDVQLLFADAVSGARSTALVSQGRIGAVVAAKPTERRKILEEAAGITGLHSRRHEAELRLGGAETNLERLDDVLVTLEVQMQSLKKQARQARRYRNLNDHIRKADAGLFLLRWAEASQALDAARGALAEAEAAVLRLTEETAVAVTRQAEAAARLPELRDTEAQAAAALQRLALAEEQLQAEEQRISAARDELTTRLAEAEQDLTREKALATDAAEALGRLQIERAEIDEAGENQEAVLEAARVTLAEAQAASEAAEAELAQWTEKLAVDEARRGALSRQADELSQRALRLEGEADAAAERMAALEAEAVDADTIAEAQARLEAAEAGLAEARTQAETEEAQRVAQAEKLNDAHAAARDAAQAAATLEAEDRALRQMLGSGEADLWPPVVDALTVEPGLETALGAALGDDLTAATDEMAPIHWRTVDNRDDAPPLPEGAEPLSRFVHGPPALARRLAQIGVVADANAGRRLAGALAQGQRLVSRKGALWRWDGFTAKADAPTPAALRLEQKNRLAELADELAGAGAASGAAQEALEAARGASDAAIEGERACREAVRAAEASVSEARSATQTLNAMAAEGASEFAALKERAQRIAGDRGEAEKALAQARKDLAGLPAPEAGLDETKRRRAEAAGCRDVLVEEQSAFQNLEREAGARQARLEVLGAELASWEARRKGAIEKQAELGERKTAMEAERARLDARPEEIGRQRGELLERLEGAEARRDQAADALAQAEGASAEADRAWRECEARLAAAREARVRAEAAVTQGTQAADALAERIAERLDAAPADLREMAEIKEEASLPDLETAERRVDRLHRERENMGPVNLRAETESEELGEQIDTLKLEREDLLAAIGKLRHGINQLNREGRARLLQSFNEVNQHFQDLFTRLFGGGRAHLTLTESDDPLEAGIEILASPPGKRLQVLSLLSGGEQALTALALLFAVFLTNPAPICVLDEVDAPLDDSNVDRFCSLVDEFAHSLSTRFLVITHHRMTMARVDRLFGVTMAERGVSQLVSVDLRQAERLRATA